MDTESKIEEVRLCSRQYTLALNDTLNIISGKWKMPIIGCLLFNKMRFKELERSIDNISPRMLSKELKELELNGIVKRMVYNTTPVTVEYELTEAGKTFREVIDVMVEWAIKHRQKIFQQ